MKLYESIRRNLKESSGFDDYYVLIYNDDGEVYGKVRKKDFDSLDFEGQTPFLQKFADKLGKRLKKDISHTEINVLSPKDCGCTEEEVEKAPNINIKLRESASLKESVSDEAYEIADMVEKSFGDRDFVTRDDFDEAFTRALQEVYKLKDLESVWDNYELPDGTDVNNLEADVRGILGYSGWGTIFEGPEEGGLTTISSEDRLNLAETMCGFIADLFKNESDDFKSNDESLYDWCEGGDAFRNAGIAESDCKVLDKMLQAINPKVQEINAIIKKESGIDLFESEKKKH